MPVWWWHQHCMAELPQYCWDGSIVMTCWDGCIVDAALLWWHCAAALWGSIVTAALCDKTVTASLRVCGNVATVVLLQHFHDISEWCLSYSTSIAVLLLMKWHEHNSSQKHNYHATAVMVQVFVWEWCSMLKQGRHCSKLLLNFAPLWWYHCVLQEFTGVLNVLLGSINAVVWQRLFKAMWLHLGGLWQLCFHGFVLEVAFGLFFVILFCVDGVTLQHVISHLQTIPYSSKVIALCIGWLPKIIINFGHLTFGFLCLLYVCFMSVGIQIWIKFTHAKLYGSIFCS